MLAAGQPDSMKGAERRGEHQDRGAKIPVVVDIARGMVGKWYHILLLSFRGGTLPSIIHRGLGTPVDEVF